MNIVMIAGYLGADPEVRETSNSQVANMRVATSEYKDTTEWHNVVAWGKTAEIVGNHFQKGSFILVHGRLQTRQWEDKEGNTRYTTEIVADRVEFGPKTASAEAGGATSTRSGGRGNRRGSGRRSSATDFPVA